MRRNQSAEYLYNVARNMMGRTKAMQLVADGLPVEGAAFRRVFMGDVQSILRSWNAETLGSIASLGRGDGKSLINPHITTLREVGLGEAMTEHMDGPPRSRESNDRGSNARSRPVSPEGARGVPIPVNPMGSGARWRRGVRKNARSLHALLSTQPSNRKSHLEDGFFIA